MKDLITIDFETRSECDISRGLEYFQHPTTKILCMGYKFNDGEVKIENNIQTIKELLLNYMAMDSAFIAHNPNFEFGLIQHNLFPNQIPNNVILRFYPTELMSYFAGGPGKLESAAIYWKLKNIKDHTGKQLINILSKPYSDKTPKSFGSLKTRNMIQIDGFIENKELSKANEDYCKQDVQVTYELFQKLKRHLPEIAEHKLHIDYALNYLRRNKGINIDKSLVYLLIRELEDLQIKFNKTALKLTKDKNFNINSSQQVLKYLKKYDDKIEATGREYLTAYRALKKNIHPEVDKFIKLKTASPKNLSAKLNHLLCEKSYDGFAVCGTGQTRRFTGFGANFLNLPRTSEEVSLKEDIKRLQSGLFFKHYKKNTYEQIKKLVRHVITAENKFYGGDFSQIEFRLLMLCCGEIKTLQKLFQGWDPYIHIAQKLFHKKDVSIRERHICKQATLAFGYGLGIVRLASQLSGEGIKVPAKDLEQLKRIYHVTFPRVKIFWKKQEKLFSASKGSRLKIPYSNRIMYFYGTRYFDNNWQIKTQKGFKKMWGGSLTGYVIQGLAGDIFNYKIRELWKKLKIPVILPIHDEVVCEVSDDTSFEKFKEIMQNTPDFIPKEIFPRLEGSFWQGTRYKKA